MQGLALKLERVRRGIKVVDLATQMGVSHPRISQIEKADSVSPALVDRYMTALATMTDVDYMSSREGR